MTTTATPTSPLAAALRAGGFVGRLVEPGDTEYDHARAGWNGAIDRSPAAVAYAEMLLARDPDRTGQPSRRSTRCAALYPFIPCTPAPGGVAAEQM